MFKKRYIFLLLMIILVLIFICTYSLHGTYNDVLWTYKVSNKERIQYLAQNDSSVLLTSKIKSGDKYFLRLFNKKNYELKSTISLKEPITKPVLLNNFIVVATNNAPGSDDYIYVFEASTSNLLWKNLYKKGLWTFKIEGDSIYYVDSSGSMRKVALENRDPIWRVISKNKFFNSTEPVLSGNKLYVCNDDILISLDKHSSKIEYNYKIPSKAIDCKFSGDLAAIVSKNEDLYVLNLDSSNVLWKQKQVLLFSKVFIDILDNSYLALLNTVDFSKIKKTKRSKVLTKRNQVLNIFDIFNGNSKWQKGLHYPIQGDMNKLFENNILLLQTSDGRLTAHKLGNGKKLWSFFGFDSKTPKIDYTIENGKVYFVVNERKTSSLFVISLQNGALINKIQLPKCKKDSIDPIIDGDRVILSCNNRYIEAVKLPSENNIDKKE